MPILKALFLFGLAGLCEIGGGYLVWLWLREGRPGWYGLLGGAILTLYGVVATLQPAGFGRTYAAYGGIFIVLALLWEWRVDGQQPDAYDLAGAAICLIGASIIFFAPRA